MHRALGHQFPLPQHWVWEFTQWGLMVRNGCPVVTLPIFIMNPAFNFIVFQVLLCIPENSGSVGSHIPGCHVAR
jgi:hypothetical protein